MSACVGNDTILLAISAQHALAKKAKVRLADLASQFLIGMSEKTHPGKREWLLGICETAGFSAKILQEAESESAAIKFVADGLGLALFPAQIAELPHEGVLISPSIAATPSRIDHRLAGRKASETTSGLHPDCQRSSAVERSNGFPAVAGLGR